MTTEYTKSDLKLIANGCCFLASGGGGGLSMGLDFINHFPDNAITITASVDDAVRDLPSGEYAVVIAFIGAPSNAQTLTLQPVINALTQLNLALGGTSSINVIKYLVPVEMGAISTIVPLVLAQKFGISTVDADGAGRAVPSLTMTTFSGKNVSVQPTILTNSDPSEPVTVNLTVASAAAAESFIRPVLSAPAFNEIAGLGIWAMDAQQLQDAVTIQGTISLAKQIGTYLKNSFKDIYTFCDFLNNQLNLSATTLVEQATLISVSSQESGGFDFGRVTLRDASANYHTIITQNESLLMWSSAFNTPVILAPDSICYVTPDGKVFSNADLTPNMIGTQQLGIIQITADKKLTQYQSVMDSFYIALQGLGYTGQFPLP
jgi:uncharacterized protein